MQFVAVIVSLDEAIVGNNNNSPGGPSRSLEGLRCLVERLRTAGLRLALNSRAPALKSALGEAAPPLLPETADGPREPTGSDRLAAAASMGIEPSLCLALESSVEGVLAARAAGLEVLALSGEETPQRLRDAGARWVAEDPAVLPIDLAAALLPAANAPP